MPDVTRLVDEARRTNTTLTLLLGDEAVATLSPTRSPRRLHAAVTRLVDTSDLPPVPYRTVDEVTASRSQWTGRAFTDAEIAAMLEQERTERWRRKTS